MKNLLIPDGIKVVEESESFGKYLFAPLERGFGITVGNSLRRVLLSSIPGQAIYAVKIEGVLHEFSTIKGIVEDVPHIVLNLKRVRLKFDEGSPEEAVLRLKVQGPKEVKAKDLDLPEYVTVMDPEHHIATITTDAVFEMELRANRGRGFVQVEDMKYDLPEGFILMDAIYSPVQKVNYTVENMRVGSRTDYEKLILEIWTDGSIHPFNALKEASEILKTHCERVVLLAEEKEKEEESIRFEERERIRNFIINDIATLELSRRTLNCLRDAGINKIYQLVAKTEDELLELKNFGQKSLSEVKEKLARFNYSLGLDIRKYLKEEEIENEASQES